MEDGRRRVEHRPGRESRHARWCCAARGRCRASSTLTSESLDAIIERKSLPFPDFIKIDVQGFELEVMKGADKCLQHSEFCLLEVSLLDLGENTPLVLDTMNFMDKLNFQLYDINTFMRRPYDNALWQNDFLFVKKNSQFVASKRWV